MYNNEYYIYHKNIIGEFIAILKNHQVVVRYVYDAWGNSVYNNFTNPNYTTGEAFVASAMDAAYYTLKGIGTYLLGKLVGKLVFASGIAVGCATLGLTIFGTTIGFIGALAIGGAVSLVVGFVGAVAIYYLGEWIDEQWEWCKKQIFE